MKLLPSQSATSVIVSLLTVFSLLFAVSPSVGAETQVTSTAFPGSQQDVGALVYGGSEVANPNPYPWSVAMYASFGEQILFSCGGFLIDPEWVMTAAHCVFDPLTFGMIPYAPERLSVVVGERDLSTVNSNSRQSVAEIYAHPQWDSYLVTGDIALLRLVSPERNEGIPVLPLSRGEQPSAGTPAKIAGWGETENRTYPNVLREADVEIAAGPEDTSCREIDPSEGPYGLYDPEWMTCAGGTSEESIASGCFGDSGSALMVRNQGVWEAVGITSWGWECGDYFLPGVYTRISRAIGWVDAQMANPNMRACGFPNSGQFQDVPSGSYYDAASQCLLSRQIVTGQTVEPEGFLLFNPSSKVTRAQVAAMLWRMEGSPKHPAAPLACGYEDVNKSNYFARAACWMKKNGVTTTENLFNPSGQITRSQMATMLWRYAGRPTSQNCEYADVNATAYYKDAVCWMKEKSITTAESVFNPSGKVSRAQAATMLWRFGIATQRWFPLV